MFKADVNLERSITIYQDREKVPFPYCKLHNKKASIVQTTLKFFTKK